MAMMQLTSQEQTGGIRPILVNSEHVVWARPRIAQKPSGVHQVPSVTPYGMGTEIALVNGDSYTVKEPYDQIAKFLVKTTTPQPSAAAPEVKTAPAPEKKAPASRAPEPKSEKAEDAPAEKSA